MWLRWRRRVRFRNCLNLKSSKENAMTRVNMNKMAKRVCEMESGAKEVDIAQTKEILSKFLGLLIREHYPSEIMELVERY